MVKNPRRTSNPAPSKQTQSEANQVANATKRPGQTKEQTKLIAQGIQKGIEQYKKQHKAKMREIDKRKKKSNTVQPTAEIETNAEPEIHYQQHPLPWFLLLLSWIGFIVWQFLQG